MNLHVKYNSSVKDTFFKDTLYFLFKCTGFISERKVLKLAISFTLKISPRARPVVNGGLAYCTVRIRKGGSMHAPPVGGVPGTRPLSFDET